MTTVQWAKDMELVVRLHEFSRMNRKPYKIDFDTGCHLLVADSGKIRSNLGKQRKRWQRGLFQCMWGDTVKCWQTHGIGAVGTFILSLFSALRIIVTIY